MIEYIPAKTIVSGYAADNGWFGVNYNMNIYKGCCHGCIYCDSRSECYHVEDFDRVRAKEHALELIGKELRGKRRTGVVGTGSMSDPYNPFEEKLTLTRRALELIDRHDFGVAIATKSDLVMRDIDVLQRISRHSPVLCKLTITSGDDDLSRKLESHAPASSRRFEALRALSGAGIYAGILLMPVLPLLEDNPENVLNIVRRAAECGAKFIYARFGVTLRQNQRDWYFEQLDRIFPGQGFPGKYRQLYGNSYECHSPRAKQLWTLFVSECERLGICYKMQDIIEGYKKGYEPAQMSFL